MKPKPALPADAKALKDWLDRHSKNENWTPAERELRTQFPLTQSLILLKKQSK